MRLKSLGLAMLLGSTMIMPAFAQPAPTPKPSTPAIAVPATPSKPATSAATIPATTPTTTPAPATTPAGQMTNINTASAADLDKLPQIGKARAAAIIKGRPYKTTDELLSRKILSKSVFDKIKGQITTS